MTAYRVGASALLVAGASLLSAACGTNTVVAVTGSSSQVTKVGPPPFGGKGALHTDGPHIVDESGATVHLAGVSWFGLETHDFAPHGLWSRTMGELLDQIVLFGFNCLRIPFSTQLFDAASTPNTNILYLNPDLANLDGAGMLDRLVRGARARGLKVILDRHDIGADVSSALWFNDQYDEQRWLDDWTRLASNYVDDPGVIGFELHNDLRDPATWGDGSANDWRAAAERAGNAILAANPNALIFVEGIQTAGGSSYWWGGNLKSAGANPVTLNVASHVVYATQDFAPDVTNQGPHNWFQDPSYPANLEPLWDSTWGYLAEQNEAPVAVTAFGTAYQNDADKQWFGTVVDYLAKHELNFAYWTLNPDSGDTGGLLQYDWVTVETDKVNVLKPLLVQDPKLTVVDAGP